MHGEWLITVSLQMQFETGPQEGWFWKTKDLLLPLYFVMFRIVLQPECLRIRIVCTFELLSPKVQRQFFSEKSFLDILEKQNCLFTEVLVLWFPEHTTKEIQHTLTLHCFRKG